MYRKKYLEIMCQINGDCLRVEIGWDGNIKNFPYSALCFSVSFQCIVSFQCSLITFVNRKKNFERFHEEGSGKRLNKRKSRLIKKNTLMGLFFTQLIRT